MRFSTRTEYGLRVLISLASLGPGVRIPAGQIAERERIPQRFLEQQVTLLRKAGLVNSRRGAGGGCSLARPADQITVADAVEALEGGLIDVPVSDGERGSTKAIRELWRRANDGVRDTLAGTTITRLAARATQLDESRTPMFYI